MSKRNTVSVIILSTFALATLCLFAAVITAQKGPQGTAGSVKPVKGIDVVVLKHPGNSAARTATTNDKGEATFVGLAPGNYSLTIVDPSRQQKVRHSGSQGGDADIHTYEIEIIGARCCGGTIGIILGKWNVKEGKFATPPPPNATAKTTATHYTDSIDFEIKGPAPVQVTIRQKSHSNTNN